MKSRYWLSPVLVVLIGVVACDSLFGPDDPVPTELTVVSGNAQLDTIDAALADPLVVGLRDQFGEPFAGQDVSWRVRTGDAAVRAGSGATDEAGRASADVTLGTVAGPVEVEATAGELLAVFGLTTLPGDPVRIDPGSESVVMGALADTLRLDARLVDRYDNAIPEAALDFASSDPAVVDVTADGVLMSLTTGSAIVTIRADTFSTTVPVKVEQAAASVEVRPAEARFTAVGDTAVLGATAYDRTGNEIPGADIAWSSADTAVAVVDGAGVVTSRGQGEIDIVARSGESEGTARVGVEQAVAEIRLASDTVTITALDDTARVQADAYDRNGNVIRNADFAWASADTTVAVVDDGGLVTARQPGAAGIDATLDSLSARAVAVVAQEAATIELDVTDTTMTAVADTVRITATAHDRNGYEIVDASFGWSSTATAVATAHDGGVVISRGQGEAQIVAARDGVGAQARVVVQQEPVAVSITPSDIRMTALGQTLQVDGNALDRNDFPIEGADLSWSSADPAIASVNGSGALTSQALGETSVTAALDSLSGTASVTVVQEVDRITLAASADTLRNPGDTKRVTATAFDSEDNEIPDVGFSWSSSRTSVATVDGTGLVTAGSGRGDATITASAEGKQAGRTVTRIPFGVLVLSFDDAYEDAYTRALPILQKHGIAGNIALPTGWVGQTINGVQRLSASQVRGLHDAGWSIVPHTVDHTDLTRISDAEVDRQLRESKQWVRDRGYRGSAVFIVPFHRWNEDEQAAVGRFFDGARGWGIEHPRHGGMRDWPASDPIMLTAIPAGDHFRTADGRRKMEDWWAEAISKGKFLGTYFHSIQASDVAALELVIERMARYKVHIRTYGELFE